MQNLLYYLSILVPWLLRVIPLDLDTSEFYATSCTICVLDCKLRDSNNNPAPILHLFYKHSWYTLG